MNDWKGMNACELKSRLKTELAVESPNREIVIGIVEELEKRNTIKEISIKSIAAWERIKSEKSKPMRSKPLWRVVVAAVLAIALFAIVPSVLGTENIFEAFGRWTKDIFAFGDRENVEFIFQTEHQGLQELYDMVSELGVTKNVVPTWLPDGFEAKSLQKTMSPRGFVIFAIFTDGNRDIKITVAACNDDKETDYQKDDGKVEILECNGVEIYIVTNNGENCAVWQEENVECAIFSDQKDEIYLMIDSIYRRDNHENNN